MNNDRFIRTTWRISEQFWLWHLWILLDFSRIDFILSFGQFWALVRGRLQAMIVLNPGDCSAVRHAEPAGAWDCSLAAKYGEKKRPSTCNAGHLQQ